MFGRFIRRRIRLDYLIVNRSFWPQYGAVGNGLFSLAEKLAKNYKVGVAFEAVQAFEISLSSRKRESDILFFPVKHKWNSSATILWRIIGLVFFTFHVLRVLLKQRPSCVYVATDPPLIVPLMIMVYAKIFKKKYIYHIQDIHPEASAVVLQLPKTLVNIFRFFDTKVIQNASHIITLNETMMNEILKLSKKVSNINLLNNPGISSPSNKKLFRQRNSICFCGNAGRLQRIPLLVKAISEYLKGGGKLKFEFAGGGIFSKMLEDLAKKYPNKVFFYGLVTPYEANQITIRNNWALLPIEDEVTQFAFPSKASSYVLAGCKILAICGTHTSVYKWVVHKKVGIGVKPDVLSILDSFNKIENNFYKLNKINKNLKMELSLDFFVDKLEKIFVKTLIHKKLNL